MSEHIQVALSLTMFAGCIVYLQLQVCSLRRQLFVQTNIIRKIVEAVNGCSIEEPME